MADEIDAGQLRDLEDTAKAIAAARANPIDIVMDPGECQWCGEIKPRIVGGACAACRDEFKLD